MMTTETLTPTDPTIYGGISYATAAQALEASWYDFLTAGGLNATVTALEYADEGVNKNLADAEANGWKWPGDEIAEDEHYAAFQATVQRLRDELTEATR